VGYVAFSPESLQPGHHALSDAGTPDGYPHSTALLATTFSLSMRAASASTANWHLNSPSGIRNLDRRPRPMRFRAPDPDYAPSDLFESHRTGATPQGGGVLRPGDCLEDEGEGYSQSTFDLTKGLAAKIPSLDRSGCGMGAEPQFRGLNDFKRSGSKRLSPRQKTIVPGMGYSPTRCWQAPPSSLSPICPPLSSRAPTRDASRQPSPGPCHSYNRGCFMRADD